MNAQKKTEINATGRNILIFTRMFLSSGDNAYVWQLHTNPNRQAVLITHLSRHYRHWDDLRGMLRKPLA
jgi:hypothetical protein